MAEFTCYNGPQSKTKQSGGEVTTQARHKPVLNAETQPGRAMAMAHSTKTLWNRSARPQARAAIGNQSA